MPVYESDPDAAPDENFVPGELAHLVAGNHGRMLDARRTPIAITAVDAERGEFELEIGAFEDRGARWRLPLMEIEHFQFARHAVLAPGAVVAALREARARVDRPLVVEAADQARADTLRRIAEERGRVREWIAARMPATPDLAGCIARRQGDPQLFALLSEFLAERGLVELDRGFAESFVTNPGSGELVKGHAIVLAELGLHRYSGTVVRDPLLFEPPWSKPARAEHLIARAAFTQELWSSWGHETVTLYRGAAVDGPLPERQPASFTSATFAREVAEDHFAGGPTTQTAVLWRQETPIERLLMTFVETAALNGHFKEAEAVLIGGR